MNIMDEYTAGRRLAVTYTPAISDSSVGNDGPTKGIDLELEIIKAFNPFTMSVVCLVRVIPGSSALLPSDTLPETFIIKLFDRRHIVNPRISYDEGRPYSAAKEAAYQQLLLDPVRLKEMRRTDDPWDLTEEGEEGGLEAFIETSCADMWASEVKAYEGLQELQGTSIPEMYGTIRYCSSYPPPDGGNPATSHYCAPGILLEFIPSTTLDSFLKSAMEADPPPYQAISSVCDQAIQLMDRMDEFNVLNRDVRLENVLIALPGLNKPTPENPPTSCHSSPSPPGSLLSSTSTSSSSSLPTSVGSLLQAQASYRCVCIDFACSRLRYPDETDEQWRRAKQNQDERGAIGVVAGTQLRRWAKGKAAAVDLGRLWDYPCRGYNNPRWYRELDEEEQKVYEDNCDWGLCVPKGESDSI